MNIKIIVEAGQTQSIWQRISVDAIVGIIGTLLGTGFGWFLNELSNRGKISVYLRSWNEEFYAAVIDGMGGYNKIPNKTQNFDYSMTLEIHNSSNSPKIIRDVKIGFGKKKNMLIMNTPKDDSTKHITGPMLRYEDISAYNIPAHEIVTIKLHGGYTKNDIDFGSLRESDSVWLTYRDEKNKTKRRLLKHIDYRSVFDNETEDIENE